MRASARPDILRRISAERERQDRKWKAEYSGDYPSAPAEKLQHLVEEVGEVARALNDHEPQEQLAAELVQVAALCVRWLESMVPRCEVCLEPVRTGLRYCSGLSACWRLGEGLPVAGRAVVFARPLDGSCLAMRDDRPGGAE